MRSDTTGQQIAAILLLTLWAALSVWRSWNDFAIDMSAVYIAGYFAWMGEPQMIYGVVTDGWSVTGTPAWYAVLDAKGFPGISHAHYVYPPLWAWLAAPLAGWLEPLAFFNLARAFLAACVAASILAAWRLMRPPVGVLPFVALSLAFAQTTVPVSVGMELVQPQLLVIFLILAAFERYGQGGDRAAGLLLGIAAAIKIAPVLLAFVFLADRRWRALAACASTAVALALASLLIAGAEAHRIFLSVIAAMEGQVPLAGLNLTFETVMQNFFVPFTPCATCGSPVIGVDTPWVTMTSGLLLFGSIALVLLATARLEQPDRTRLRLFALSVTTLFFAPLAWMHYYALPLLLFPGLLVWLDARRFALLAVPVWLGFSRALVGYLVAAPLPFGLPAILPQHAALIALAPLAGLGLLALIRLAPQRPGPEGPRTA